MTTIQHTPLKQGKNSVFNEHYTIAGNDIESIIDFCSARVRAKSWGFYKEELKKDLQNSGKSLIDIHAGMGTMYSVQLNQ